MSSFQFGVRRLTNARPKKADNQISSQPDISDMKRGSEEVRRHVVE